MVTYVWISIQSDAGITMGELGRLPSDTDTTLIAATLMALKDIVSIEASSGESQFMTGEVETSSFGTFAIPINEQSKLILSYIISADTGETVDASQVKLIQSLTNHLGKQLTQFSFITVFMTSGAVINRTVVTKAFINACTIVRMEFNLPTDERRLKSGYNSVIEKLFQKKENMLEAYNYILGDGWQENPDMWHSGLLLAEEREKIIVGLSEYIVFLLANQSPLLFLYSPNPRNEQKIVLDLLREEISLIKSNSQEPIVEALPDIIKKNLKRFIGRLTLSNMHQASRLMFDHFVRKAYVETINNNPLIVFISPDLQLIQQKYKELLPSTSYDNVATILKRSLNTAMNERSYQYTASFYDGFINELSDTNITQSAMAFLVSFAQQFVSGKELRDNLQAQPNIKKSWIRDIIKHISPKSGLKSIKQLKVDSINDAIELTNAAGYSIVNTIATMLSDQFLLSNNKVGYILRKTIEFYQSMGVLIKTSSTLVGILEQVATLRFRSELITPLYQDLIGALIIRGNYELYNEDTVYKIIKKKGLYYIQDGDHSKLFVNFINEKTDIMLKAAELDPFKVKLSEIDVELFNRLVDSPEIIIDGIKFSVERRIQQQAAQPFNEWYNEIEKLINELIVVLNKAKDPNKVKTHISSQFSLPRLNYIPDRLDEKLDRFIEEIVDKIEQIWEDNKNKMKEIISSSTTRSFKKDSKKIQKLSELILKSLAKITTDLEKTTNALIKEIHDSAKSLKKQLKEILDPTFGEILKYQREKGSLLLSMEEAVSDLTLLYSKYKEFSSDQFERLLLSISLTLFEKPPDVLLDYAYNEVISGKLSNSVKLALNKGDTKEDFELILKSQAHEFSSNIFTGLSEIISRINDIYVSRDSIVTTDRGKAALHMGRIPLSKYPKTQLMNELLNFEEINFTRETSDWSISLSIAHLENFESEEPTIVTFSDAAGYIHRNLFIKEVGQVFEALSIVAAMIEPDAGKKVNKFWNNLTDTIFSLV